MSVMKTKLEMEYDMTNLGELCYCLGMEFTRDRRVKIIIMNQAKYVVEVLKRFGREDCKSICTLLDIKVKLEKLSIKVYNADASRIVRAPYKSTIGSLMYDVVATKADLVFAISMVS